jgi:hypothetical protein
VWPQGASTAQVIPTEEYNRIVQSADLVDLRLMDCQFEVKPGYLRALAEVRQGVEGPEYSLDLVISNTKYVSVGMTV